MCYVLDCTVLFSNILHQYTLPGLTVGIVSNGVCMSALSSQSHIQSHVPIQSPHWRFGRLAALVTVSASITVVEQTNNWTTSKVKMTMVGICKC